MTLEFTTKVNVTCTKCGHEEEQEVDVEYEPNY